MIETYTAFELLEKLRKGEVILPEALPDWFHRYDLVDEDHEEYEIRRRVAESLREQGHDLEFSGRAA